MGVPRKGSSLGGMPWLARRTAAAPVLGHPTAACWSATGGWLGGRPCPRRVRPQQATAGDCSGAREGRHTRSARPLHPAASPPDAPPTAASVSRPPRPSPPRTPAGGGRVPGAEEATRRVRAEPGAGAAALALARGARPLRRAAAQGGGGCWGRGRGPLGAGRGGWDALGHWSAVDGPAPSKRAARPRHWPASNRAPTPALAAPAPASPALLPPPGPHARRAEHLAGHV